MEMVMFDVIDTADEELMKKMIYDHLNFTGSDVASELLKNWEESVKKFVKVMPVEYKAVLEKRKLANVPIGQLANVVVR